MNANATRSPAAYVTWFLLVAVGALALLGVLLTPARAGAAASAWSTVPVLWLLFAVPGVVLLHGHALSATGDTSVPAPNPVPSTDTAQAAARSVWGVLTVGVVLSLVTARVSGAVSPSVWPGTVMFMLLILARPGRAKGTR